MSFFYSTASMIVHTSKYVLKLIRENNTILMSEFLYRIATLVAIKTATNPNPNIIKPCINKYLPGAPAESDQA